MKPKRKLTAEAVTLAALITEAGRLPDGAELVKDGRELLAVGDFSTEVVAAFEQRVADVKAKASPLVGNQESTDELREEV